MNKFQKTISELVLALSSIGFAQDTKPEEPKETITLEFFQGRKEKDSTKDIHIEEVSPLSLDERVFNFALLDDKVREAEKKMADISSRRKLYVVKSDEGKLYTSVYHEGKELWTEEISGDELE